MKSKLFIILIKFQNFFKFQLYIELKYYQGLDTMLNLF